MIQAPWIIYTWIMDPYVQNLCAEVSRERLEYYTRHVSGIRHAWHNYEALEEKADFICKCLGSLHLALENQAFTFHGRSYRNLIATKNGTVSSFPSLLLGAHYDAAWGSPGADDNASGVAVMLEAARILAKHNFLKTMQFVAFTMEEPQPQTLHFLIGSNHFAKTAKQSGKRYEVAVILESVGYTDDAEGSQVAPFFVTIPVPKTGDFLGVISNRKSKNVMDFFCRTAAEHAPGLKTVPYKVPFSGRIIPETRFSDHASFWDFGYTSLMLTDTAMFRNPYYHTHLDTVQQLDFQFMANVTKAVIGIFAQLGKNIP
jgi:Zn-dependent M28 family amino/carboxypeptidase